MTQRKGQIRRQHAIAVLVLGPGLLAAVDLAAAEVRFGHNVFIGGHDFSHQTYNRRHRLRVTLFDGPIRGAGCVTRRDGRGGTLRTCRLRRIPH